MAPFITDPLPLILLCGLLYMALAARNLERLTVRLDADNAARAAAQQERWLAK